MTVAEAARYHRATYSIGLGAGRLFARQVDLSGARSMIDIGGGSGAYCIGACRANPELRAIVLDLPPVVAAARGCIAEQGLSARIEARSDERRGGDGGGRTGRARGAPSP